MDFVDPKFRDWLLNFVLTRPDFERKALAIRGRKNDLADLLYQTFDLANLPDQIGQTVANRLLQVVLAHTEAEAGTLYRKCTLTLLRGAYDLIGKDLVPDQVDPGPDFEQKVVAIRADLDALRAYITDTFRSLIDCLPQEARERAVDQLLEMARIHDPDEPETCTLGMKCFLGLVSEVPPEQRRRVEEVNRPLKSVTLPLVPISSMGDEFPQSS